MEIDFVDLGVVVVVVLLGVLLIMSGGEESGDDVEGEGDDDVDEGGLELTLLRLLRALR